MADIAPFQPYRYSTSAGPLEKLVTQPYDKISPAMQRRYLSLDPHNLVRIILGERFPSDSDADNVYTRAAAYLEDWIARGVLARDAERSLFAYSQEFTPPGESGRFVRLGFIGLGAVEDYAAGVVHRHEQTLAGPKRDRMDLLRHTRAHCGQLFMLYPDPERQVDGLLEEAAQAPPDACVEDEYGCLHRLWRISSPPRIEAIRAAMAPRKLLIADGHHRYETALAFRDQHPELAGARRVMMTFVNMYSPGLKILATHRLVKNLERFDQVEFLRAAGARFRLRRTEPVALTKLLGACDPAQIRIAFVPAGAAEAWLLERDRGPGDLDVSVLHQAVLGELLGVGAEAVRDERHLSYARGAETAIEEARRGAVQIAFLLAPVAIEQVAEVSFGGGVMPQKSTDFYPKLLSGLTIYRIDE